MQLDQVTARRVERANIPQRIKDAIAHVRETGCLCQSLGYGFAERWAATRAERIKAERLAAGFTYPRLPWADSE